MESSLRLKVTSQADVEQVRRNVRNLAASVDLEPDDTEALVLAASELASNLVRYAIGGEIWLSALPGPGGPGLQIESIDQGPGISDLGLAMRDGFSSGGGLGSGLPGVRRLTDEFAISSGPTGTRVVARKWPGQT